MNEIKQNHILVEKEEIEKKIQQILELINNNTTTATFDNNSKNDEEDIVELKQKIETMKTVHESSLARISIMRQMIEKMKLELQKSSNALQLSHQQVKEERIKNQNLMKEIEELKAKSKIEE